MSFQIDSKTAKWLLQLHTITQADLKQVGNSLFHIDEQVAKAFENGTKVASIVQQIYRTKGLPPPQYLTHLKVSNQTAAQLHNWNYLNQAFKKIKFEVDPETKNMIINGDRQHLAMIIRQLFEVHTQSMPDIEDSLDTEEMKPAPKIVKPAQEDFQNSRQSLSLSRSEDATHLVGGLNRKNSEIEKPKKVQNFTRGSDISKKDSDLLEYVVEELMSCINISRQQAVTLLEDNNKYLAHILVKGVKGEFSDIEQLMERWFRKVDFIVHKMGEQNDMCFFFLQVIKPALLSKSQEIAQWACRILSRIAHELANKDMLPLAYDWFIRDAGGLSTTILALSRHPKLNQHVVGFILEFSRYNVAEVFTVELKKITSSDQLAYIRFVLLLFEPLVESKMSSEELLNSGAIDYWVETSLKGASQMVREGQLKLICLELLTKIWRAYPVHVEEQLDKVNQIMGLIKRGIREGTQIVRFTLLELLFSLLDEFASKKNPYASVVYKKLTFLFIENHEELQVRQFMLRNFNHIISKYQSIPVDIFLEPFVKQIKIKQNQSYFLNVFDLQFINSAVNHRKLSSEVALQFFDLLAKIKLNNYDFTKLADVAMETLIDRYLGKDIFLQYTAKLVKVSLAKFYNTLKHKRKEAMSDQERLQAQKRAQIINFIISLLESGVALEHPFKVQDKSSGTLITTTLYEEIKAYTIQVKIQIQRVIGTTHKGIERILEMFPNVQSEVKQAMEMALQREQTQSNMTSHNSKQGFRLPKMQPKYLSKDRDQVSSQQSGVSQGTRYSNRTRQEFPQQDYTKFAEQDEKKFLKEHGIGFKKKQRSRKPIAEIEVDPKVQEQLIRARQRKEEDERKKIQQQQKIRKRKEMLEHKIQKELEQRNLMQGIKGNEKDVQVKVIFEQNEINQKLIEEQDFSKNTNINQEENRDSQSVKLVIRRHLPFLKKLFNRYSCGKMNKRDFFDEESDNLAQIDLIRLCKQKNLEKNKQNIIEITKQINDKNIKSLNFESFTKFLQYLTAYIYIRDKMSTHTPMGDLTKALLKKMAFGQNFKLEDDQDQTAKGLGEKVRYNPHIDLPDGYKKVYERVYAPKRECSFPTKKAINHESYTTCYEVVNQLLFGMFNFHILEEEVRFYEEARVVKKNVAIPPRPLRREKQQPISLLEDRETVPTKVKRTASNINRPPVNRTAGSNRSIDKTSSQPGFEKENKPKPRAINAAERKKLEEQELRRQRKQQQEEEFKKRQQQIKKRMERVQQDKERENSRKKEEKKAALEQEEEKKRRQKEQKERYQRQQKQKLDRYRRQREEKQKEEKEKEQAIKQKEEEERKQKLKLQLKRDEIRRREQAQKRQKERELSEEKNKRKKEEEDKKNKMLKEQVQKKLEEEKNKYQVQKLYKELMKNIYQESSIQNIFNNYKEELKNLYGYGKQYNEYKLGGKDEGIEQKGWNTICQQLNLTDPSTANALLKQNQKEKGRQGLLYEDFQETLLGLAVKQRQIEPELDNYENAQMISGKKLEEFLRRLKIPKDKHSMKDYFVGLKNSLKKREEVAVVGPGGEQQTWEIQHK